MQILHERMREVVSMHYHPSLKSEIICIIVLLCCCLEATHSWVQPYPTLPLPVHRSDALTRSVKETPVTITCLCLLFWIRNGTGMQELGTGMKRQRLSARCPGSSALQISASHLTTPSTVATPLKVCCILIYTGCRKIVPGDGIIYCP